ncbi:MAG: AAA family ATPase [Candidatus Gastranaerophilales bacterium]|nr:AAA family ATPase [Candidatus Gastranaerophilales bacterium]
MNIDIKKNDNYNIFPDNLNIITIVGSNGSGKTTILNMIKVILANQMEDCSDVSEEINKKSQICLANNFIFLEFKQSGIRNLKYLCSTNELLSGDQYLDLYSFYLFEQEYKKYCDSNYVPTAKNLILSDREKGYRILRFYKHLFKLIDEESPSIVKLEQLFFGIPIAGITLIPTLIKILKERKNLNYKGRK